MGSTTITIDTSNDEMLMACVAQLDQGLRRRLSGALRAVASAEHDTLAVRIVRTVLEREKLGADAVGVRFGTAEAEDGWYVEREGTVLFTDGTTVTVAFDPVEDVFRDEFGSRQAANFTVTIDVRAGHLVTGEDDDPINALFDAALLTGQ